MFSIRIRSLELSLLGLSFHKFSLTGEGIEIHLIERQLRGEDLGWGPAEHDFATGRFVADRFRLRFNLDPSNPIAAAKSVVRDLFSLARTGRTSAHVELAGETNFFLGGSMSKARTYSRKEDKEIVIVLDKEDLRRIAKDADSNLTPHEIDLLSSHPLQAPTLLRIKHYAERTSKEAWMRDSAVPEDAYRHVLWSYLLTRGFGAELARKVTDAHENATADTDAGKRMDLNNNAVGRIFAANGFAESDILELSRTDPRVVRSAAAVDQNQRLLR